MASPNINIERVDYTNSRHGRDLRQLLLEYAEFETEADDPIDAGFFDRLPELLHQFPTSFSVLAYRDQQPLGLTNCFFGFSTFLQKRLVNIHDVVVTASARGQGVPGRMLAEVEAIARENDCCRLTLEVLDNNQSAWRAYEKLGFGRTPYHPENDTLFLQKTLSSR